MKREERSSTRAPQVVPTTVGESLYWSYAQIAMAFASAKHSEPKYQQIDFVIRSKTYYGLLRGKLNLGSLYIDEREKINSAGHCAYCAATDNLSLDHLVPRLKGGDDSSENLVTACRSCNSSKGARDILEWTANRGELPTLVLLRRYLKLAIRYCVKRDLMKVLLAEVPKIDPPLPFSLHLVPHTLPEPDSLIGRLFPQDNPSIKMKRIGPESASRTPSLFPDDV